MPDTAQRDPSQVQHYLPLSVPAHQILLSLADADRHGYALIQDIRERTGGEVELTASTLYGALARMADDGLLEEVHEPEPEPENRDRRRRYYRLTELGRDVARAEARRLQRALEQARAQGLGPEMTPDQPGRAT